MLKFKIIIFCLLFITNLLNSQEDTSTKIKVYVPSGEKQKLNKDNSYSWVLKTDGLAMLTGEFPLIFEYRIARKFSIEASAGITYAFLPNNVFDSEDFGGDDARPGSGSAFRGTIKYYASSDYDAIEGWGFGIQFFTKTTTRILENFDDFEDKKVKTGISLVVSKQIFEDSNIALEWYAGAGICNVSFFEYEDISTPEGGFLQGFIEKEETRPNFQLGFRIGFGN